MTHALVDLVVEHPRWLIVVPDLADIAENSARAALFSAGLSAENYEICAMACDDERISALNGRFRSKPVPTNVLSWPSLDLAAAADGSPPADPPGPACGRSVPLGDLALSLETMEREARDQDLHLKSHTWHLILHGCLHLLGYDHERPGDAALMEGMESRVLRAAGLPDPYC